jgi:hypothetical protein
MNDIKYVLNYYCVKYENNEHHFIRFGKYYPGTFIYLTKGIIDFVKNYDTMYSTFLNIGKPMLLEIVYQIHV